jgi:hypothetical protein
MKKRRKVKFRKLLIKISDKQQKLMDRYCKAFHLTPNKLMRQALREYMERNAHRIPDEPDPVSKNQLKLFDNPAPAPVQLSILDEVEQS